MTDQPLSVGRSDAARKPITSSAILTLDRWPKELLPLVGKNGPQRARWRELFEIDQDRSIDLDLLAAHPRLPIETRFFDSKTSRAALLTGPDHVVGNGTLIKGEALDALRYLLPRCARAVDLIFIDPPYNTGEAGLLYSDSFSHAAWETMIRERIRAAYPLLANGGSFWATIDDREAHRLQAILHEQFGEENFLGNIVWQKRTSPDARVTLSWAHDYVQVYAKNRREFSLAERRVELSEQRKKSFKNPDQDPRGAWASTDLTGQLGHATADQFYTIRAPGGAGHTPPDGRCWAMAEATFVRLAAEGRIWFGRSGNARPRLKHYLSEARGMAAWTWWPHKEVGHNQEATRELSALFGGGAVFDTVKPLRLLARILRLADRPDRNTQVLDFFAGSGTTAHAVIEANALDGGSRRFTLVESSDTFEAILVPRVLRALHRANASATIELVGLSSCTE